MLNAISCTSSAFCVAVGSSGADILVETWDGSAWSLTVSNPHPANPQNELHGVSCRSATSCVAVGFTSDGTTPAPSSSRGTARNGRSRRARTRASARHTRRRLVRRRGLLHRGGGRTVTPNAARPLIERWNGSAWKVAPGPVPVAVASGLSGVSCVSITFCMTTGSGTGRTLVETWDGSAWSIRQGPPVPAGFSDDLADVSCPSATNCVAVADVAGPTPRVRVGERGDVERRDLDGGNRRVVDARNLARGVVHRRHALLRGRRLELLRDRDGRAPWDGLSSAGHAGATRRSPRPEPGTSRRWQ